MREHLDPGGHLGHTYLWYLVDNDTFNRFLYNMRLLLPDPFAATSAPLAGIRVEAEWERSPFGLRRMSRPDDTSVACVVARRDTDVGFRVTKGSADVGGARRARAVSRAKS